jgi:hypothetical protein
MAEGTIQIFYEGNIRKSLIRRLLKEKFIARIEPGEIKSQIWFNVKSTDNLDQAQYTYQRAVDSIMATWDDRFYVRWINRLLFTDFIQKRIQAYKKKQVEAKRQEIRRLMKEIKDGGGLY